MEQTALITGTTSGIGKALAEQLAREKFNLILVSRNQEKLEAQAKQLADSYGVEVSLIALDLMSEGAAQAVYDRVQEQKKEIQILVNNAGFDEYGAFTKTDLRREQDMIQLHTTFITQTLKLFLPSMIQNGYGRILNLGSIASYIPCPYDAVYAATKAYVLSFSKAVNAELKGTNVSVTTLCPGATATEFAEKAEMEDTWLFKVGVMKADKVAKIGYRAMMKKKAVAVPGAYNKMLVFLSKILPEKTLSWGAKWMLKSQQK